MSPCTATTYNAAPDTSSVRDTSIREGGLQMQFRLHKVRK